jgi:DeoR family fructose operon transcriptional repressor
MIPAERRQKLLDLISEQGTATIADLSSIFAVSEMTIHRDLKYLETSGRVLKTYGGVIASESFFESDYELRRQQNIESKQLIGKVAATLISENDSIILDGSTTVLAMVSELVNKKNITVFTSSVAATSVLSTYKNIELYSTGGLVLYGTNSYIGQYANEFLKNIHADKCFVSASAISASCGITDPLSSISEIKRSIAKASKEVILLVDHSKFGLMNKFNSICFSDIDLIITDADETIPCVNDILKLGVEILFVEPNHT